MTLTIRPEDLRRTEQIRATVHQTMGRNVTGWVDSFGEGLPSLTISGHTGWRYNEGNGMDGAQHFEELNQLVSHDFPAAQQSAIERGIDPAEVKLLFIDMLDGFAYSVFPTSFVLQRSKSRPLLFQYNIAMQAIDTAIDSPEVVRPEYGGVPAGLTGLDAATAYLEYPGFDLTSSVQGALSIYSAQLSPLAGLLGSLTSLAVSLFQSAATAIRSASIYSVGLADPVVELAARVARAAVNVYRAVCAIPLLPAYIRAPLGLIAASFNELVCIFSNSLRSRVNYENYEPLFGASGCSSTTGGRQRSAYADQNAFALMQAGDAIRISGSASASLTALAGMDTVLSPMDYLEIGRHIAAIIDGVTL